MATPPPHTQPQSSHPKHNFNAPHTALSRPHYHNFRHLTQTRETKKGNTSIPLMLLHPTHKNTPSHITHTLGATVNMIQKHQPHYMLRIPAEKSHYQTQPQNTPSHRTSQQTTTQHKFTLRQYTQLTQPFTVHLYITNISHKHTTCTHHHHTHTHHNH